MRTLIEIWLSNGLPASEKHFKTSVPWEMDDFEVEDYVYDIAVEYMEENIYDFFEDGDYSEMDYEEYMNNMEYDYKYRVVEDDDEEVSAW